MAEPWKSGDDAVIYLSDGHKLQAVEGSIHDLLGRPGRWWFIPKGGRVLNGTSVSTKELHRPHDPPGS